LLNILDMIAAACLRAVYVICAILPVSIILGLGRGIGAIVAWFSTERRSIGYANLRAVFCSKKTPAELLPMIKNVYKQMAETLVEILCIMRVDMRYVEKFIEIENSHYFLDANRKGKGVIFLTAHYGNWELSAIVSALKGFPFLMLVREQKMKRLNALIDRVRASKGTTVIRKGLTTRTIVKALHSGKAVGMIADQSGGPNGIMANFFNRPTSNPYGVYRFAAKTGAVIIPVFMIRKHGPYHKLILEKPIEICEDDDYLPYVNQYNDLLASYVSSHVDHWLWAHRRWKLCPVKKVVVLSDGKAGHVNQSLSLADAFKRYRKEKGINEESSPIEVIDIKFKNKFAKTFISLCGKFSSRKCQGCLKCLKFALQPASYEKLVRTYADVVISTGYSLAAVNSIFKFENNAKNAICMRPGMVGFKKIDMIVLPRHDVTKSRYGKKVIITDTMPTLVNSEYLKKGRIALRGYVKSEHKNSIGILLGGRNQTFSYSDDKISRIMEEIVHAAKEIPADILCTTSRRTSNSIERRVKEILSTEQRCKLLVIANEKNLPYAMGGILGLSNVIVVSGESISMVSEAVSSGKKTIVFVGERRGNRVTKHEVFLNRLSEQGCIRMADENNISELLHDAVTMDTTEGRQTKSDWVYLNMWRLGG